MRTTIGYWRGLAGEKDATQSFALAQAFATARQLPALQWVKEQESLEVAWTERSLGTALKSMQHGDYLLVSSLLMLATSMDELCDILAHLLQNRLFFYTLDASCSLDQLEHFPLWQRALTIFQQLRWDMRSESTKQGLRQRQALGLPLGRPLGSGTSQLDEYRDEIVFLLTHGATRNFIVECYHTNYPHLKNWLERNKIKASST